MAPNEIEFLVGLGEELYLEGSAGAAANLFDTVFDTTGLMTDASRERVLDWWASALDHEARPRSDIDRQPDLSADSRPHATGVGQEAGERGGILLALGSGGGPRAIIRPPGFGAWPAGYGRRSPRITERRCAASSTAW